MDLGPYLVASGVRELAGRAGVVYSGTGRITFARAPVKGIDSHLFVLLSEVVDQERLALWISSVDTGAHVPGSRHYQGRAVDISQIGDPGGLLVPVSVFNPLAVRLVKTLLSSGFHVGEGRPWAAILFGAPGSAWNPSSVPHNDHLHVSLPRRQG